MKVYIFLLFLTICHFSLLAQKRIYGVFDQASRRFITEDTTYWIGTFKDGLAKIAKGGYIGLINDNGVIIIEPKYDKVLDFDGPIAIVCLNHKYGLINTQGKELILPSMYFIDDFYSGLAWFKASENGFWGLMDKDGKIVIEPQFNTVYRFKDGFAYCKNPKGTSIIISKTGKIIYREKRSITTWQTQENNIFEEGLWVNIDAIEKRRRRDLSFEPEIWQNSRKTPFHFFEGLALIPSKVDNKVLYGYINQRSKKRVDFVYENAHNFVKHTACVKKNGKWGVINKRGKVVIPFKYETLQSTKADFFIFSENEKYGVISSKGEIITPPQYLGAKHLWGSIFSFLEYSKEAYKIIKSGYHKSSNIYPELAAWGVIDIKANDTILPFQYYHIKTVNENFGIGINYKVEEIKDSLQAFQPIYFEQSSLPVTPIRNLKTLTISKLFNHHESYNQFNSSPTFFLGYFSYNSNIHWQQGITHRKVGNVFFDFYEAIVDHKGLVISDSSTIRLVQRGRSLNGLIKTVDSTTNKQGVQEFESRVILPSIYEKVDIGAAGIIVQKNSLFGYYDLQGKEVLPFVYQRMEETVKGTLKVTFQNREFIIDKKGNKIKQY